MKKQAPQILYKQLILRNFYNSKKIFLQNVPLQTAIQMDTQLKKYCTTSWSFQNNLQYINQWCKQWTTKTSFISLYSNIYYNTNQKKLERIISFFKQNQQNNNLTSYNSLNQIINLQDYQFQNTPKPGIESLTMQPKTADNGVRQGSFVIKCFTLQDLDRITKYFCLPSSTVFVQFGWTTDFAMKNLFSCLQINQLLSENPNNRNYLKDENIINAKKNSNCHLECFNAFITNFTIDSQKNIWTVTVQFMTLGTSPLYCTINNSLENKVSSNINLIKSFLNDVEKSEKIIIKNKQYFKFNVIIKLLDILSNNINNNYISNNIIFDTILIDNDSITTLPQKCFIFTQKTSEYLEKKGIILQNINILKSSLNSQYIEYNINQSWFEQNTILNILNDNTKNKTIEIILKSLLEILSSSLNHGLYSFIFNIQTQSQKTMITRSDQFSLFDTKYIYIPTIGINSIVRSSQLNSTLPDSFKSMVISNNLAGQNTKIKLWGDFNDALSKKYTQEEKISENTINVVQQIINNLTKLNGQQSVQLTLDENKKQSIKKYLQIKKINQQNSNSTEMSMDRLTIFNLKLSMDGISGFQYGNIIVIDGLPKQFRLSQKNNLVFLVKSIQHNITKQGWVTDIQTQPLLK